MGANFINHSCYRERACSINFFFYFLGEQQVQRIDSYGNRSADIWPNDIVDDDLLVENLYDILGSGLYDLRFIGKEQKRKRSAFIRWKFMALCVNVALRHLFVCSVCKTHSQMIIFIQLTANWRKVASNFDNKLARRLLHFSSNEKQEENQFEWCECVDEGHNFEAAIIQFWKNVWKSVPKNCDKSFISPLDSMRWLNFIFFSIF